MRLPLVSRPSLYDPRYDTAPTAWWQGLPIVGSADPDAEARWLNRERVQTQQVAARQKSQARARKRAS